MEFRGFRKPWRVGSSYVISLPREAVREMFGEKPEAEYLFELSQQDNGFFLWPILTGVTAIEKEAEKSEEENAEEWKRKLSGKS